MIAPSATRKAAAKNAGLSDDQAKTAIRLANTPGESFEEQIESDQPPTVTVLAAQGKQHHPPARAATASVP